MTNSRRNRQTNRKIKLDMVRGTTASNPKRCYVHAQMYQAFSVFLYQLSSHYIQEMKQLYGNIGNAIEQSNPTGFCTSIAALEFTLHSTTGKNA